jgi:hypothetical protein
MGMLSDDLSRQFMAPTAVMLQDMQWCGCRMCCGLLAVAYFKLLHSVNVQYSIGLWKFNFLLKKVYLLKCYGFTAVVRFIKYFIEVKNASQRGQQSDICSQDRL